MGEMIAPVGTICSLNSTTSRDPMRKFPQIIERLKQHYGKPAVPPVDGLFELILWENAAYLLPDERRVEVFNTLRTQVGLNPEAIENAPDGVLLPIAIRGGMRPAMRVFRWRQIAQIALSQFGGNVDAVLHCSYEEARKALKQFPNVSDQGAERILLLCDVVDGNLPLESNGLRVVGRLGWGHIQKNYASTYRSVQETLKPELPSDVEQLKEAHLLLRVHGRAVCKEKMPLCHQCPVAAECAFAQSMSPSLATKA